MANKNINATGNQNVNAPQNAQPAQQNGEAPQTFKNVNASNGQQSAQATNAEGEHVTQDGKPDRRYLENRAMSEEEARVKQAENVLAQNGK